MRKILDFLKSNIAFFVIVALSLIFYLIGILGGDYQTATFFFEVTHYQFITGLEEGIPLAFLYVIIPAICLGLICVLYFLKPKKKDGPLGTVFVALFIGLATVAGAMIVLIPFALFKDASVQYAKLYDWRAMSADVFFVKTYNFPLLSMLLSLIFTLILGCYSSAKVSD